MRTTADAARARALPPVCGRRALLHRRRSGGPLGVVRLDVLREHHGDAEIVARHEAQLVERARILLSRQRAVLQCIGTVALGVVVRVGAGVREREQLDGAEVAEGVARVHDAEILLCKLSAVAGVGIDRAEGIAGEWVAVLDRVGRRVADRREELIERRVFPIFVHSWLTPRVRRKIERKHTK